MSLLPVDCFFRPPASLDIWTEWYQSLADRALLCSDARGLPDWFIERMFGYVCETGNMEAALTHVDRSLSRDAPERLLAAWENHKRARDLGRQLAVEEEYQPSPLRKRKIEKNQPGKFRTLNIPALQDRYIGRAVLQVIAPILLDASVDQRRGRGVLRLLAALERQGPEDHPWWIAQDFENAFDRVPQQPLEKMLRERLQDERLTTLIMKLAANGKRGIVQGCSLSPLLLDFYLAKRLHNPWGRTERIFRYVDDLLIPCRTQEEARAAHGRLEQLATSAGMTLKHSMNEAIVDVRKSPVRWLGYELRLAEGRLEYRLPWAPTSEESAGLDMSPLQRFATQFHDLRERHVDAWQYVHSVVDGQLANMAPAFPYSRIDLVYQLLSQAAAEAGFEVRPYEQFHEAWQSKYETWTSFRTPSEANYGGLPELEFDSFRDEEQVQEQVPF